VNDDYLDKLRVTLERKIHSVTPPPWRVGWDHH